LIDVSFISSFCLSSGKPRQRRASRCLSARDLWRIKWGFDVNDQLQSGWLAFLRPSGERQKHISASSGALATGCKALGLYSKKSLLAGPPKIMIDKNCQMNLGRPCNIMGDIPENKPWGTERGGFSPLSCEVNYLETFI
jgi:hypothetical protein